MLNLKLTLSSHSSANRTRFLVAALLLAIVALMPIAASVDQASAASTKRVTLGKGNLRFKPNCGKDFVRDCIAEGKITAFQSLSTANPGRNFVVPFKGKLISWSIKLANPTRKEFTDGRDSLKPQIPAFDTYFGAPSQARISVLRQVEKKKKGPPRFKLVSQSPVQILNPYFGTTVQFALSQPLNVNKGLVIALTIPTWAPALWSPAICNKSVFEEPGCVELQSKYTWRASRAPDKCSIEAPNGIPNEALEKTRPQMKVGSVKRYGCYYGAAALLYSATIVGRG